MESQGKKPRGGSKIPDLVRGPFEVKAFKAEMGLSSLEVAPKRETLVAV